MILFDDGFGFVISASKSLPPELVLLKRLTGLSVSDNITFAAWLADVLELIFTRKSERKASKGIIKALEELSEKLKPVPGQL